MKEKRTFKLKADSEFIELNKLLKAEQIAQTGGHVKFLIAERQIIVNQEAEYRVRRKLRSGDIVVFEDIQIEIQ
jgi:ribosome-associated protein